MGLRGGRRERAGGGRVGRVRESIVMVCYWWSWSRRDGVGIGAKTSYELVAWGSLMKFLH